MAAMRGPRTQVGSADWITEERASALNIAQAEAEEFSFSVRNEFDWLNEHMADVFNENEINIAEVFKTPGKLRGKTPRTARKLNNNGEPRVPLSDIFSSASKVSTPFAQQLGRMHSPKLHTSQPRSPLASRAISPLKQQPVQNVQQPKQAAQPADSGYYGSQSQDPMNVDSPVQETQPTQLASPTRYADISDHVAFHTTPEAPTSPTISRTIQSPTRTFQTAKEEQTTRPLPDPTSSSPVLSRSPMRSPLKHTPVPARHLISSPGRVAQSSSPKKSSPLKPVPADDFDIHMSNTPGAEDGEDEDEQGTPSDSSSPIRPVMRKSSLNFASLPAREPLTSKKSLGPRSSRPSNDHRTSHYGIHATGKSFGGNVTILGESDDDDDVDMEGEANTTEGQTQTQEDLSKHHKTYTQRLQDQINMLGKSQPNASRQSKSIPSSTVPQPTTHQAEAEAVQDVEPSTPAKATARSPSRKQAAPPTPGAFPEDEDEDDWIAPPTVPQRDDVLSPRPALPKSHTADVMEGIHDVDSIGGAEFVLPKQRQADSRQASPQRAPAVPDRSNSGAGHHKSASVSVLPEPGSRPMDMSSPKKGVSVSNPTLALVDAHSRPGSPPKSPSRSFRDSPLKQVKNKLSSIIKSSKGLLASSAVLSAEGKASLMSPSTTRLGLHAAPSTESLAQRPQTSASLYPDLSSRTGVDVQSIASGSPARPVSRRTRASVEREKEEKRKEKEAEREARLQAEQLSKLEKAREKEREKARVFSKDQEKTAPVAQTPAPKDSAKPVRTSPRKAKPVTEVNKTGGDADIDMIDAASAMPPPSVLRSAGPSQATRGKEVRRPVKPPKDAPAARQAPTVIRVNTGSQHSQYRPSNAALASGLRDTLAAPASQLRNKTSQASLQSKPSLQSLKGSASSGRPKALEMAAKRKEQEEREAQRKREAKLEIEKKRAALQEEERKADQQKRQEAEQQKEKAREQTTAKKNASRQAALEKAKQTRAPPPAVRSQPNGPPDYAAAGSGQARPPSRLATASQRSQDDAGKPTNTLLSHGSKAPAKRPLQQEGSDAGRNPQARNGMSYQAQEAKRRRTSDDFFDELDMESQQPNIKGPPVRPSGGLKKDMPAKSMYSTGYTTAPPQSASRDLFKATVTAQHTSAVKTTQHMDMSQFSKGAIPFAPNPNSASQHKTPARPPVGGTAKSTAKSAPRSSPRFQNGESIELPEIETDDEDEDEDDSHIAVASWADSPELRRALMRQEPMDPGAIFGPPAPLNMEEVFSKSKDKWHKFRARTSSANWSGADRLTEDDIRKDLAARDKMRREGAWSYEVSKDLN